MVIIRVYGLGFGPENGIHSDVGFWVLVPFMVIIVDFGLWGFGQYGTFLLFVARANFPPEQQGTQLESSNSRVNH